MKILYFAWVKEKTGIGEETLNLPDGVETVAALIDWLKARAPGYGEAFADEGVVRVAVNQEHVDAAHPLAENDEVAFFPPVTGG